jgi:hypothetical protein
MGLIKSELTTIEGLLPKLKEAKSFIVIINNGTESESIIEGDLTYVVQSLAGVMASHPDFDQLTKIALEIAEEQKKRE